MNYLKLSAPPTLCELEKARKIIFKSQVRAMFGNIEPIIKKAQDDLFLHKQSIVHLSEKGEVKHVSLFSEEGMNVFAQAEKNPRKFLR